MQTLQIKKQINKTRTSGVAAMLFSTVLTVCSFLCLLSVFDFARPDAFIIIFSVLIPPALYYSLSGKTGKYINTFLPIAIAVYFAALYDKLWKGYLTIANSIITRIDQLNNLGLLTYDTGSAANIGLYTAMALIPVILILAYLIVISIRHRLFLPVILLTFPFAFAGIYFQAAVTLPAVALILIGWIVILSGGLSEKSFSLQKAAWVFMITLLFGAVTCFVTLYLKYTPLQAIGSVKEEVVSGIEHLRYQYGAKKVQMDILPNGDLKSVKTLAFTDEVVMRVKMQKPSAVYLKGYVGSVYSGSRWSSLPPTAYSGNYTGLFEWLAKKNFYPQSQITALCGGTQLKTSGISVENLALESKYIYAPYEAVPTRDLLPQNVNYAKDSEIFSSGLLGTRNYSFSMYPPISKDYGTADFNQWEKDNLDYNAAYTQYLKNEKAYRAFVYHSYLDVPAKTEKALESYFSKETIDSLKGKDTQSVVEFLRRYYSQKLTYAADIKPLPENSDFVENFLKTGSGYDVHFATLSVMLLRSVGIPARYVEGYYLPHSYVDIYAQTENATLDVKDSFAHAWTEIYVDGVGWVPAELTPGYYNADKDSSKNTGNDEKVSKKDKNLYNDQDNALTNNIADNNHQSKKNSSFIFFIIAAAVIIMAAFAIAAAFIRKAKRNRRFAQPDKTKAALAMYAYAAKLIQFDGIRIDRHASYEASDEISKKYDPLTGMSFTEFLDLVYKVRFGSAKPDAKELEYMHSYVNSFAKTIYVQQGLGKKLVLKLSGMI